MEDKKYVIRMLTPTEICPLLIGRKGVVINEMRSKSKAKISIDTHRPNIPKSVVQISGKKTFVETAMNLFLNKLKEIKEEKKLKKKVELNFLFTYRQASAIIGPKGAKLKKMRKSSKVFIYIDKENLPRSNEKLAIVRGTFEEVKNALAEILKHYFEIYKRDMNNTTSFYEPEYEDFIDPEYDAPEQNNYIPNPYEEEYYRKKELDRFTRPNDPYNPNNVHKMNLIDEFDAPLKNRKDLFYLNDQISAFNKGYFDDRRDYFRYEHRTKRFDKYAFERPLIKYAPNEKTAIRYPINKGLVGGVIGRAGVNITKIRKETGALIKVHKDLTEDKKILITINGEKSCVRLALVRIENLVLQQGM